MSEHEGFYPRGSNSPGGMPRLYGEPIPHTDSPTLVDSDEPETDPNEEVAVEEPK